MWPPMVKYIDKNLFISLILWVYVRRERDKNTVTENPDDLNWNIDSKQWKQNTMRATCSALMFNKLATYSLKNELQIIKMEHHIKLKA